MTDVPPSLDAAQAAQWLSAPRYGRYLGVAGGDHALAMETYLWNSRVAAARITDAKRGLSSTPTHAEVVAALTFGFWSNLTVGERTPTLWNPMLHRAFPKGTGRARVHDLVARVVKFRNRLAHNEPVFSTRTGLEDRLAEVQELFELLDPDAYAYVAGHSTLGAAIRSCPIPGLTTATGLR